MNSFKSYFSVFALIFVLNELYAQPDLQQLIKEKGKEFSLNVDEPLPDDFINLDTSKYKIYISGEIHGIPSNPIVQFKFFQYLHKNANVRNLIIESGVSSAFMAQKYLQTGDENYLCSCWVNELTFWQSLRSFNLKQPEDEKIRIIGIDFERNENFIKAMKEILPDSDPPIEISESIYDLRKVVKDSLVNDERIEITRSISKQLKQYLFIFQEYLGDNFSVFSKIINNQVPYTASTKRDKRAYKHFVSLLSEGYSGNFYGQYGISHVNLTFGNIADLLNSDKNSPFKESVFTIIPHYYNCSSDRNFSLMGNEGGFGFLNQSDVKAEECITIGKSLTDLATFVKIEDIQNYKKLKKGSQSLLLIKDQKAKRKADSNSKML